jgi:hypothetical protein
VPGADALRPFTAAGKAVLQIEYAEGALAAKADEICPQAKVLGFSTLIKRLSLNAAGYACR